MRVRQLIPAQEIEAPLEVKTTISTIPKRLEWKYFLYHRLLFFSVTFGRLCHLPGEAHAIWKDCSTKQLKPRVQHPSSPPTAFTGRLTESPSPDLCPKALAPCDILGCRGQRHISIKLLLTSSSTAPHCTHGTVP